MIGSEKTKRDKGKKEYDVTVKLRGLVISLSNPTKSFNERRASSSRSKANLNAEATSGDADEEKDGNVELEYEGSSDSANRQVRLAQFFQPVTSELPLLHPWLTLTRTLIVTVTFT